MGPSDVLVWSFKYFYHGDKANAASVCAPVQFSPLTFRVFNALMAEWPKGERITPEMEEVRFHLETFELSQDR